VIDACDYGQYDPYIDRNQHLGGQKTTGQKTADFSIFSDYKIFTIVKD